MNCCTMARKFVVSVLSKVVGVRREARDRRLVGFETRPSGPIWVLVDAGELELPMGMTVVVDAVVVVVRVGVGVGESVTEGVRV